MLASLHSILLFYQAAYALVHLDFLDPLSQDQRVLIANVAECRLASFGPWPRASLAVSKSCGTRLRWAEHRLAIQAGDSFRLDSCLLLFLLILLLHLQLLSRLELAASL